MAGTHPGYIERHSGNGLFNYPRRQMVIDLIRQRADEEMTVIIATHDDDLEKFADTHFAMGSSAR